MFQPSFYIFGVPNGFDILDGDINTTNYFQSYYNPSKENTKFSIHRKTGNGGITYAYLKYNLSSGKGREGSFFGMALTFPEKAFCTNILKLYRLFDTIYEKVILADGEILKPTDGTSYIQAKYTITRFSEKREYIIQRVFSNLLTNLEKFADTFVDCSCTSENPDVGKRIPLAQADNDNLLNLLQRYNRLSISPDWRDGGPNPEPIPVEVLWSWNQNIKDRSLYVNKCYRDLSQANLSEVKKIYNQINQICGTLKEHPYSDKTDPAVLDCYNETYSQYNTLKKDYYSLIVSIEKRDGTPPPPPPPPLPPPPPVWWKKIIAGGVAIITVVVLFIGLDPFGNKQNEISVVEQKIRNYIKNGDYETAKIYANAPILPDSAKTHFKDTIADLELMRHLQDTVNDRYCYSYAWDETEQFKFKVHKDSIQCYLVRGCTSYIDSLVNAATSSNANSIKDIIKNCKVNIDESQKQKWTSTLDCKSSSITPTNETNEKKGSQQVTSNIKLEIYETNSTYEAEDGTHTQKNTYEESTIVQLDPSKYYTCKVVNSNGVSGVTLSNSVQISSGGGITKKNTGWIRIHNFVENSTITINNNIIITLNINSQ